MDQIEINQNGYRYFHRYKPDAPLYISVLIPNLSYQEPALQHGISHLYEHFLCRENALFSELPLLKREIARRGVYVNAHTSLDCIKVHMGVPDKEDFEWGVDLLLAMLHQQLFKEEALDNEVKAIQNEINILQNNPGRYIYSKLYQSVLLLDPENIPNYGSKKDLVNITIDQVKKLHQTLAHQPKTIISSGDLSNEDFRAMIKSPPQSIAVKNIIGAQKVQSASVKLDSVNSGITLGMAYPIEVDSIEQVGALDILAEYLGHHAFGELIEQLRYKLGYIYGINVGFSLYRGTSMFTISTNTSGDNMSKVERAIKKNLSSIMKGDIDTARVEIIKSLIMKNAIANTERTAGWVIANERLLKYYPEWGVDYSGYLDTIKATEPVGVIDVATRLFMN